MRAFNISLIIICFLIFFACEPREEFSPIPYVSFKSISAPYSFDSSTIRLNATDLVFEFRDGDSDFGVDTTKSPKEKNLFIYPFYKVDGIYDSTGASRYNRFYSISENTKLNRNGALKGEIKVQITYLLKPPYDTIRYEFYIVDRAGNKSNTGVTRDFVW